MDDSDNFDDAANTILALRKRNVNMGYVYLLDDTRGRIRPGFPLGVENVTKG